MARQLSGGQHKQLHNMITSGYTNKAIVEALGISRKTITEKRHKINGTQPEKAADIGFLSVAHIREVGMEEAERLFQERKNIVDFFGFVDSQTGEWRPPRFPGYRDETGL